MYRTTYVPFLWCKLAFLLTLAAAVKGHAVLEFSVEPSDTVVEAGQSAVLDCVVRASHHQQSVLITWLDEGGSKVTFIGDLFRNQLTNGSLYINSVIEEQRLTGTYQCMATLPNVGSIVSRTAKLSIARLNGFHEEPSDITVYLGQKAHFACYVDAVPTPRIRWLKDERPLQINDLRMTVLPSGALEIDEVEESDQGSYRCNASGLNSHILSNKATLYINMDQEQAAHSAAPSFIARPRPATVVEGQNVTLDCAANGNPVPRITWLKDGFPIDMNDLDSRFSKVGSTSSLRVTRIQEQDGGTYQCRAENREDSLDASALIGIQVPPRFLKKPQDRTEYSSKDVELECSVYGIPEPKIHWLKNGDLVKYSEYYKLVNGNNLKIMGLMVSDSGIFQCFASNPAGNIQASANLKVQNSEEPKEKKKRPKKIQKSLLQKKQSISFFSLKSEEGGSLDQLNFGQMRKPNLPEIPIDPHFAFSSLKSSESGDDLNLGDQSFDSGDVQAFSSLKSRLAGGSERTITEGLPGAPQDLKAVIVKARFVILSWKPPVENAHNVEAYAIYWRQDGSDRERYQNTSRNKQEEINIGSLWPGKIYHFRVVPITAHGPGVSSATLTVTTQAEENVPSAPQNFEAFATNPRNIHIRWKPPEITNGRILMYTIYYMETLSSEERNVDTTELQYDLGGLTPYTEYNIWVVAVNAKGAGDATQEKLVRTFSALPTEPPSNVSVEPSSTSVVVRWEPPPIGSQNGVILGYKIKYRKNNSKGKGNTTIVPAHERHAVLNNLDRGATYQVRIWSMNINGTGPPSDWIEFDTFQNDLDESVVPDQPRDLKYRPTYEKLFLIWSPPANQNVRVRSYIIGWGKGIPDQYTVEQEERNRTFVIEGLEPNSEYVISLRASNNMGPGPPIYATAKTQDEPPPEPTAALLPPVGLKAQVGGPTSVVLYWTDPTLKQTQYVRDNRLYKVKYTEESSGKTKIMNSSDLNINISDLKPNTLYEFAVKLVKGRRESGWSMVVQNRTWELPPDVAPRNVDVHFKDEDSQLVEITWLAPKTSNGRITGYVILYTDNKNKTDALWKALPVKGDNHSSIIYNLEPFTLYYFKVQARNSRGYGPFSNTVFFRTGQNVARQAPVQGTAEHSGVFSGNTLLLIIIGSCILVLVTAAFVVAYLCCRRRENTELASPNRDKKGYQKGNQTVKPPDLWIHHDQMELKAMEKRHSTNDGASSSGALTLPRSVGGNDYDTHDNVHTNSLDKRTYVPNYAIATPINTATLSQSSSDSTPSSRPNYPRTNYQVPRTHMSLESTPNNTVENVYSAHPGGPTGYDGPVTPSYINQQAPPGSTYAPGMNVLTESQAAKRVQGQGHPLKSFTVPAPPPVSAPGTPQPKHIVTVRPTSSPYKKPPTSSTSTLTGTPPSRISTANPPPHTAEEMQRLQPSHSTEELNQEMANLEGLMLTLNAITANEFEC
ncbi:neogenin isoform X2 [Anthonomus grandis grandis]|uniref:neogenin isoform X2 n=1 Tax=Anthonomus grandis grandis TaxID=2921223 RepID=UPI002165DA7F|nr:neogenin isoform X2 [Anthonomus grandis grandis]